MGYQTHVSGSLEINPKEDIFVTQEELLEIVEKTVGDSDLRFWEPGIESSHSLDTIGCDIYFSESGRENVFGDGLEFFLNALSAQGIEASGEVEGFGDDPDDRWRVEVSKNVSTFYVAEIVTTYRKVSSFEEATSAY